MLYVWHGFKNFIPLLNSSFNGGSYSTLDRQIDIDRTPNCTEISNNLKTFASFIHLILYKFANERNNSRQTPNIYKHHMSD